MASDGVALLCGLLAEEATLAVAQEAEVSSKSGRKWADLTDDEDDARNERNRLDTDCVEGSRLNHTPAERDCSLSVASTDVNDVDSESCASGGVGSDKGNRQRRPLVATTAASDAMPLDAAFEGAIAAAPASPVVPVPSFAAAAPAASPAYDTMAGIPYAPVYMDACNMQQPWGDAVVAWVMVPANSVVMGAPIDQGWSGYGENPPTGMAYEMPPVAHEMVQSKSIEVPNHVAPKIWRRRAHIQHNYGVTIVFDRNARSGLMTVVVRGSPESVDSTLNCLEAFAPATHAKLEGPTTVMIKNFPLSIIRSQIANLLAYQGFGDSYDFLYLPMDFHRTINSGYAFLNLRSFEVAMALIQKLSGFNEWHSTSVKNVKVTWATQFQGAAAYANHFRNSPVMHPDVPEHFKPLLLAADGTQASFPPPTKRIRAPYIKTNRAKSSKEACGITTASLTPAPSVDNSSARD